MAHTAMSGNGTTAGDDPLQTAVWRLRSRACWVDAAALIEPDSPQASLQRTALLVERCLYTEQGWEEAEDALRTAEAQARTDDERGAAACERGQLAYAATLFGVRDRSDEARAALGRAAALIAPVRPAGPCSTSAGVSSPRTSRIPRRPLAPPTAGPTPGPPPMATCSCSPSPGVTSPDSPSVTASWPRPGTASPNRCASARSWAISSAPPPHSSPWPTPHPNRRRPGSARRRGDCSVYWEVYRRGWHGSWHHRRPRRRDRSGGCSSTGG